LHLRIDSIQQQNAFSAQRFRQLKEVPSMKSKSPGAAVVLLSGVCALSAIAFTPAAQAIETNRVVTISAIHPVGSVRPSGPESQNIVRLYVNAAAWGSTTCRQDAADISNDDMTLFAVLMMAWRDHKSIQLYVDDTQKLVSTDTVCRIVAAFIQ
jgi:hypothetical protein